MKECQSAPDDLLVPLRMINEYVYCPRLAYLEWVQGEWVESADTLEGSWVHRRVDREKRADEVSVQWHKDTIIVQSLMISSLKLGIIGKIDLLELEDNIAVPVDYKKSKRPHTEKRAWEPEMVQLCAQGLILREKGFQCREGIIYFAGSRERVHIDFDEVLEKKTLEAIEGIKRFIGRNGVVPKPLKESNKCFRCALVSICIPEEVNFFKEDDSFKAVRPIVPSREWAFPLYVTSGTLKKNGEVFEVWHEGDLVGNARIGDTSAVVIFGSAGVSTPAVHEMLRRNITLSYHSYGGWFLGHTIGTGHKNVELRIGQYKAAFDGSYSLKLAKTFVAGKIYNCRTLLRRNGDDSPELREQIFDLKRYRIHAENAKSIEVLLGIEGAAGAVYFRNFWRMIKEECRESLAFDFEGRNRRPPVDPVNTMLSFGYGILAREWTVVLSRVGFDPYFGFYHRPKFGRPALALDMMESFRPLIVDSVVITAINNRELKRNDFIVTPFGCTFKPEGKKAFIKCFERRMSQEVTHPLFGYRISYRRLLEVQARLLARVLLGEIDNYKEFITR